MTLLRLKRKFVVRWYKMFCYPYDDATERMEYRKLKRALVENIKRQVRIHLRIERMKKYLDTTFLREVL